VTDRNYGPETGPSPTQSAINRGASSYGAPVYGDVHQMLQDNPDLFAAIAPGWSPTRIGYTYNVPSSNIRGGRRAANYNDTIGLGADRFAFNPTLSGGGQEALDAFFGAPLTELQMERSAAGEEALGRRAHTEWFLTLHGLGPSGAGTPRISSYSTRDASYLQGQINLYDPTQRADFLSSYGLRGPASQQQVDYAGQGGYRAHSTRRTTEESTGVQLLTGTRPRDAVVSYPAGSFEHQQGSGGNPYQDYIASDLLLDAQNIINRDRQFAFGVQQTPGSTQAPPPAAITSVENLQQARRKRKQLAFAARGRGGRGGPARPGLLVDETARGSGVGKLGGGTAVGVQPR